MWNKQLFLADIYETMSNSLFIENYDYDIKIRKVCFFFEKQTYV
jgi:hypothetical protein